MHMPRQPGSGTPTVSAETGLHVYILGPPRVEWAGHALDISRRQVRALLYRLAAEPQPTSREHLCYLFWADTPESTARRNLTGLLAHLRRALPVPELLVAVREGVGLADDLTWVDARAFSHGCADHTRSPSLDALRQAADLYRGPFLDGFSLPGCPEFEEWTSLERQAQERCYLKALVSLVEDSFASGEVAAAIDYAQRYLSTDELAEEMHRQLIVFYAMAGDRSAALRQYERCALILERELGVSPLPETQAAYQAILETRLPPRSPPAAESAWTTLPSLDVALVGRDETLRRLEGAYARARAGHGTVILISGEPGIGKSRLVQEFAARLQGQALLLKGTGYPDAQMTPYSPIVEALRPAVLARHFSLHVPVCCLSEASALLPELRLLRPDLPPPVTAEAEPSRTRLFEALCSLTFGLASGQRPVLLCLDDLHWADNSTLDWLAYLSRRLQGRRLLVIGTYRSEEASAVTGLRDGLIRQGAFFELELAGLDEAAILQLLHRLPSPVPDPQTLAGRLYHITGGNPFFILEMLRVLIESGPEREVLSSLDDLPLPDTVQDAVEERVRHLSHRARQMLEAGAVLGQTFGFAPVHLASGRREMEAMDGLDELVARHLLTEQPSGYQFRHEIIQMAVYRQLGHWRRRVLHRRAGEALEKLQPDNAAALARHFERAEEPGRAARYALQAGQAAKKVFAHVEGRAHFERALTLLEREAAALQVPEALAANRRWQIQALYDRGWALRLLGDMAAYAEDLQKVARLAELLGDGGALAHLRWREAYTHRWFCRYSEALQSAQEGARLSQAAIEPWLEARCWRELGMAAREMGDYCQAQEALERALALFAARGDAVYEIHVLGNLSTLHWYLGEYQRAFEFSQQALARCDEAGLPLQRRLPLGDMGAAAAALGDSDLARQCLEESLSIARQTTDCTQEILCLLHLGWLCIRLKQPSEALQHLQASLALAEQIGSCTEQSWLHSGLAEAHRLAGRQDQAAAHARRALKLARTSGAAYDQKLAHRILKKLGKANSIGL